MFPIVPFRTQLDVTTIGTNVGQEVELNLDFDYRQVFDVMMIQVMVYNEPAVLGVYVSSVQKNQLALFDDPNKATTTDISFDTAANTGEATFENDQSLVYIFDTGGWMESVEQASDNVRNTIFIFEQPWVVARNLKWVASNKQTTAASVARSLYRATLWGRRRRATEKEFYSIVQRQRF